MKIPKNTTCRFHVAPLPLQDRDGVVNKHPNFNSASTTVTEVYLVPLTVGGNRGSFAHSNPPNPHFPL